MRTTRRPAVGGALPRPQRGLPFDSVGNRLTEETTAPAGTLLAAKTYGYDARDRLTSSTDSVDPSGAASYTWDANGNQTSETRAGLLTEYLYDARDQLTEVRLAGSLFESYGYDYKGLRVRKSGLPGRALRLRRRQRAAPDRRRRQRPGQVRLRPRPPALATATEGRRTTSSMAGSVVDLMRPDCALQARYQYDAWGNLRSTAGLSFKVFGFTGHERDEATGLYYFKARYYDPETGRFLTEDPFEGTRAAAEPASLPLRLPEPDGVHRPDGADRGVKKLAGVRRKRARSSSIRPSRSSRS